MLIGHFYGLFLVKKLVYLFGIDVKRIDKIDLSVSLLSVVGECGSIVFFFNIATIICWTDVGSDKHPDASRRISIFNWVDAVMQTSFTLHHNMH